MTPPAAVGDGGAAVRFFARGGAGLSLRLASRTAAWYVCMVSAAAPGSQRAMYCGLNWRKLFVFLARVWEVK